MKPAKKKVYDQEMATVRITEAELSGDVHAVLTKFLEGAEVIVERGPALQEDPQYGWLRVPPGFDLDLRCQKIPRQ